MSDTGPGIVVPIGIEDTGVAAKIREIADAAIAATRRVNEATNPLVASVRGNEYFQEFGSDAYEEGSPQAGIARSLAAVEAQAKALETRLAALADPQYQHDLTENAINRTSAETQQMALFGQDPEYIREQAEQKLQKVQNDTATRMTVTGMPGGIDTLATSGLSTEEQRLRSQNLQLYTKLGVSADQQVSATQRVLGIQEDEATESQQLLALTVEHKVLMAAWNDAVKEQIAQTDAMTTQAIPAYENALGRTIQSPHGGTAMGARRASRHNLGTLTGDFYRGARGHGENEDEEGRTPESQGLSGMRGGLANIGGISGIAEMSGAAFGGYAAFMLGMYVINDLARFFMGMAKEAVALQNALAPLTVTFSALGMSTETLGKATSQSLSLGIAAGMDPSQVVPVSGMAAAQFGAGGIGQALTAATQYGKITGASPTDAYGALRSIGVPFGENNLSNVSDTIVATSQKFGVSMQDVAQGLSQVALAAENSGLTLHQTATIVGRAAQVSGLTSAAEGSAFARILTGLQTNLPNIVQLGQEMPGLGTQLTPDILASANPGEILGAIGRAGLTGPQQLLLAQSLGIGRQDVAALGVLRSVSDTNNGTIGGPTNTSGATTQMFDAEMRTFTGQLSVLGEELKTAGAEILGTVLPAMTDLVGGLATFGGWVGDVVKALNTASHSKWIVDIPVIGPLLERRSGAGGGHPQHNSLLGPEALKYMESQNYTRAEITDLMPDAKFGNYHAKPGGHLANPHFGTVASGATGPALSLNQAELLGADDPTLQSLFSTGQLTDFGGFFQNLMGQRGSELGALKSGKLDSQGLAAAAKSLQQIQSVVQQAVTLQTAETTSAAQLTSSGEGNVQAAQLKDQIDGAKKNVDLLANVVAQDPTPENIKAYNDARASENQLNNQLAAYSAQIAQQGLQARGQVTQAQDLGKPILAASDQITNLNSQITQLRAQAAAKQIDPQQAANQIAQLQAQVITAQYQQAQTQFEQGQAPLTLAQGEAQLHAQTVTASQLALQLATQKLTFIRQHTPGDLAAIDAQKLIVDQQTLAVMQAQNAQDVAGLQTQAAILRTHGQLAQADALDLQAAQTYLKGLAQQGIDQKSPEYRQALQQVATKEQQANQDYVNVTLDNMQTLVDIHQMSLAQEIPTLQALINSPQAQALGPQTLNQLKQTLQGVYNQLAQNLQFDLPNSIDLKGLFYTGKRIAALGSSADYMPTGGASGAGAYQDNRTITVTITTGATTQQVQQALSDTLSTANRTSGTGTRLY